MVRPVYVFDSGVRVSGHLGFISHATVYEDDFGAETRATRTGATFGIGVGYQFGM